MSGTESGVPRSARRRLPGGAVCGRDCAVGRGADLATEVLTVTSNPSLEADVTVSPSDVFSASDGTTDFTRTYDHGTSVHLTAAATAIGNSRISASCDGSSTTSSSRRAFDPSVSPWSTDERDRRLRDGRLATASQVHALRECQNHRLAELPDELYRHDSEGALVSITPPKFVRYGSRTWCFYHWVLNGVDQPGNVTTFRIRMRTANTLTAEYRYVRYCASAAFLHPGKIVGPLQLRRSLQHRAAHGRTSSAVLSEGLSSLPAPGLLRAYGVTQNSNATIRATYAGLSGSKRITLVRNR